MCVCGLFGVEGGVPAREPALDPSLVFDLDPPREPGLEFALETVLDPVFDLGVFGLEAGFTGTIPLAISVCEGTQESDGLCALRSP